MTLSGLMYDRVRETTLTQGIGPVVLLGAAVGCQSFAVVGDAKPCLYTIADSLVVSGAVVSGSPGDWEAGRGTYWLHSGPILSRDTVYESSNLGSLVNLQSGVKDVFIALPAETVNVLLTDVHSGDIASGNVGWPHLASGAVRSGLLGDGAAVSGSVASGVLGAIHISSGTVVSRAATVSPIVSGLITPGPGFTELVSGVRAVSSKAGGFAIARAATVASFPAIGIVIDNVDALAALGDVYTQGAFSFSSLSGMVDFSGYRGQPVYVGRSGQLVTSSGSWNSGGFQSGDTPQVLGTVLGPVSMVLNVAPPFASGGPALGSGVVQSGNVGSGSVQGFFGSVRHIASGTVGVFDFGSGAVVAGSVGSGAVQSGNLASGSVGINHLQSGLNASGIILSGQLGSGQAGTVHVASGGLGSGAIGSGQIDWIHCISGLNTSGIVLSGQLGSGQVGKAHVCSGGFQSGSVGSGTLSHPVFFHGAVLSGDIGSGQVGLNHLRSGLVSGLVLSGQVGSGQLDWPHVISGFNASGIVQSGQLGSGQIGTVHVTSGGLQSGSVGSGTLAHPVFGSGAVLSGDIASGQVGINHLQSGLNSSGMVLSGQIGSGQVDWVHCISGLNTSGIILSGQLGSGQVGSVHVCSGGLLSGSFGSGQVAHPHFGSGAVLSGDVASGQIGQFALASGSVGSGNVASGSLSQFKLASGAVNSGQIGSGAVVGQAGAGAFTVASGTITTNDLGSGCIVSGLVASGQLGRFHHASGQLAGFELGSGAIVSGRIASGQIGFGHLANASVQSGTVASGQLQTYHHASGDTVTAAQFVSPFVSGTAWSAITEEAISGFRAVCLSQSGNLRVAMASVSGRMPAIGIVKDNVASGISGAMVYSLGTFQLTSGMVDWSGSLGQSLWVGRSGQVVTFSGSWNSGGFASGDTLQSLGTPINSGGALVEIVPPSLETAGNPVLTKGSVIFVGTMGVLNQDNDGLFWDDVNDRLGIGTNAPDSPITISANVTAPPAPIAGTQLHMVGADGTAVQFLWDVFAAQGNIILRRADTTDANPSALQGADIIGAVQGRGHDGSAYSGAQVAIQLVARNTWTTADHSTYLSFRTTTSAALTMVERFQVGDRGFDAYNGDTTAGNGMASVVGSTAQIGLTTSQTATTLFTTNAAGLYRFSYYLVQTSVSAGTVTVGAKFTDPQHAQTVTSASFGGAQNNMGQGSVVMQCTTGSTIQWLTTVTGTITYNLYITVERMA